MYYTILHCKEKGIKSYWKYITPDAARVYPRNCPASIPALWRPYGFQGLTPFSPGDSGITRRRGYGFFASVSGWFPPVRFRPAGSPRGPNPRGAPAAARGSVSGLPGAPGFRFRVPLPWFRPSRWSRVRLVPWLRLPAPLALAGGSAAPGSVRCPGFGSGTAVPGQGRRVSLPSACAGCRLFPDAVVYVPVLDHGIGPVARYDNMVEDEDSDTVQEALELDG